MPAPWTAWRRILSCKLDSERAVHDPKVAEHVSKAALSSSVLLHSTRRSSGSCCSKSYNNLKNVVHGNTRVVHRAETESPPQYETSGYLQAISREAILLSPGPEALHHNSSRTLHLRKLSGCYDCSTIASCEPPDSLLPQSGQSVTRNGVCCYSQAVCQKCGENFSKAEALEQHHATQHTVTELKEGDSARNIVEIIFQTSWLRKDTPCGKPERILKVHNSPKTISKFEEYRDMVKAKANKLPKKHSRCIADGNELLRFYSTTISCPIASGGSSALCSSVSCNVCQILRFGFFTKGQLGIYTTASSGKADESVVFSEDQESVSSAGGEKRAMLVCRVIAGRVKKIYHEDLQDEPGSSGGYDSVAGEAGPYTNLEELLVFNPRALLPCFVVIYSCC